MSFPENLNLFNLTPGILEDECESEYELHDGTLVMPVMGDSTQTPVVVRLHPPYTTRKVRFQYIRTKTPPLIPPPADTRPNGIDGADTVPGATYLGGDIALPAPKQNSDGELVYKVRGKYDYLVTKDVRTHGQMRFDAHGYLSLVDFLGYFSDQDGETWSSPYFDFNFLGSARILG